MVGGGEGCGRKRRRNCRDSNRSVPRTHRLTRLGSTSSASECGPVAVGGVLYQVGPGKQRDWDQCVVLEKEAILDFYCTESKQTAEMACYAALLDQPPASLSPCTSSRAGSCRVRPPPLVQRRALHSSASARISPRCSYAAAGGSAGAGAEEPPAAALRRVLETPGAHQAPACYDALSARLVERAGFRACFTSGFSISAARLGLPDVGLMSYGEMVDQGRLITEAVSVPVIGDADNGYGNSMNVKRTVKGFINAGFAGIILEDQVSPKACGHTQGRKVVSREEAIMHIKAAVDARKESGSDIVIVARTDSRQALSLDEALWRARAFADAGADVLFIDALASREEMKAFCAVSPGVPKMANMLEGGGKTPILSPLELEEIGYKIIAYPLSLIGVSMRAMEDALVAIKGGRIPPPGSLPSFEEIKDTLGFNHYYEEEKHYIATPAQSSYGSGFYDYTSEASRSGDTESRTEKPQEPIIDILPQLYDTGSTGGRGPSSGMWSRTLRLRITGRDGVQKMDARIPAGFLEGMTKVIPGLAGANIMERLRDAPIDSDNPRNGQILLDFEDGMGDRIQVFIA